MHLSFGTRAYRTRAVCTLAYRTRAYRTPAYCARAVCTLAAFLKPLSQGSSQPYLLPSPICLATSE